MANARRLAYRFCFWAITGGVTSATAHAAAPPDSLRLVREGNRAFIVYRVKGGQTLLSLARRYHQSLAELKAVNPALAKGLKAGQILKIPYETKATPTASSPASAIVTTGPAPAKPTASAATKPPAPTGQPSAGLLAASGPGFHVVGPQESLFGVARQYKVTVSQLQQWNEFKGNTLRPGTELAVTAAAARRRALSRPPETTPAPAVTILTSPATTPVATTPVATTALLTPAAAPPDHTTVSTPDTATRALANALVSKSHAVVAGQTLSAVARLYNVPLVDLRRWNGLLSDTLRPGQLLTVRVPAQHYVTDDRPGEETPLLRASEQVAASPPVAPTVASPTTPATGPVVVPKTETPKPTATELTGLAVPAPASYRKNVETGIAEVIDGTASTDKYLALHRTAPVGTIIQVRNLNNDLSVFAKVIGKLPNTGANDKLVVKLSNKAYERLSAVDRRFRVEVSYPGN